MKKAKRKKPLPRATSGLSTERQIVRLNHVPLRQAAESECRRAMHSVAQLREKIVRFERVILPAYERWQEEMAGGLLAEQRELEARIADLEGIIEEVAAVQFWSGFTKHEAYEGIMRGRREEASAKGDPFSDKDQTNGRNDEEEDADKDFPEEERMFRSFLRHFVGEDPETMNRREYKQMFREFKQQTNPNNGKKSRGGSTHSDEPNQSHPPKIKELYRLLVRRLHPDSGADYHGEAGRLWNELQAAYKANDLNRLEILLAATEVHDNEGAPRTTLFHLRQVTAEFLRTERHLKAQFAKLRKSPAGRFESTKSPSNFAAELQEKIRQALASGRERLQKLENLIASWKTPPPRASKPKHPAKKSKVAEVIHPDQQSFDFFE